MNIDDLKKPFEPHLISWRVGAKNRDKTSAIALAYIDARDVMERLDEVCGVEGWQVKYSHANGKTIADIGIKINDEWVWKASGAGDTQVEAEKGAISDALKRAAVVWGVGRYLYDVENMWVEITPYGRSYKIKDHNDPKLANALDKAAKGIRFTPFDGKELKLLREAIRESKTEEEFDCARQNARAAWSRMNDDQRKTITEEVEKRAALFAQAPDDLPQAAE